MSYCQKCGAKVEESQSYCNSCGAALVVSPLEQQPVQSQQGFEQPTYQQTTYQQPTYQQTTYQQPTNQQTTYQQPTNQQPTYQQPIYQQPTYQQTIYQQPSISNELPRASKVLGKVSFGLGLAALISGVTLGWILYGVMFAISFGIPGIICGGIGNRKAAEANMANPKAKSGVTMSVIGMCVSVIELIFFISVLADAWSNYYLY